MSSMSDYTEVIPGVLIHNSEPDLIGTLRRLFPQSHFASLWEKYPRAFGVR